MRKCLKDSRRYPDKVLDKNKSPRKIHKVKNLTAEKEEKESSGIESDSNLYENYFPEIPAIESSLAVFL